METKDWILLGLSLTPLVLVYLYSYNYEVFYFLYNYSGLRAIVEKIHPPTEEQQQDCFFRKPSTFMLWAVSIYIAIFSIASARYDRAVNLYEMQIGSWQSQMTTKYKAQACSNIAIIQRSKVPQKTDVLLLWDTIMSLFIQGEYKEGQDTITRSIQAYKKGLSNAELHEANLNRIDLSNSNLQEATLTSTQIKNAKLISANLKNATLTMADMSKTDFSYADMRNTIFYTKYLKPNPNEEARFITYKKGNLKDTNKIVNYAHVFCLMASQEGWQYNTILNNCTFYHTDFRNAVIDSTSLINSDIKHTDFRDSTLNYSSLSNAQINDSDFRSMKSLLTKFINTKFIDADFRNATFIGSNFTNATFINPNIKNTSFIGVDLRGIETNSTLFKDITKAKTLFESKMPPKIEKKLKKTHPHLFTRPEMIPLGWKYNLAN